MAGASKKLRPRKPRESALRRAIEPHNLARISERSTDWISIRLPPELRGAMARAAEQEQRTISGQARYIIARAFAPRQPAA